VRIIAALAIAAPLALCACAGGMIPGKIYSEQGKILEFQIEKATRSGAVTAFDPALSENFTGTYVGILETIRSSSTGFVQSGNSSATGFGFGSMGSNIANATAYLTGNKGTKLSCEMNIEAGFSPHGIGGCTDQKGGKYRLQF